MKPEETKTFLELAAANPIEATLIVIGTLVLVALFAGAKKVGETIAVGPKAVRGGLAAIRDSRGHCRCIRMEWWREPTSSNKLRTSTE